MWVDPAGVTPFVTTAARPLVSATAPLAARAVTVLRGELLV